MHAAGLGETDVRRKGDLAQDVLYSKMDDRTFREFRDPEPGCDIKIVARVRCNLRSGPPDGRESPHEAPLPVYDPTRRTEKRGISGFLPTFAVVQDDGLGKFAMPFVPLPGHAFDKACPLQLASDLSDGNIQQRE